MHVSSLIKQTGMNAMRRDEKRALRPWQEIRGSSDARLHQTLCGTCQPQTHKLSDMLGYCDTVFACVCVIVTAPLAKLTAHELIFFSFWTLVPLDARPNLFTMLAAKL